MERKLGIAFATAALAWHAQAMEHVAGKENRPEIILMMSDGKRVHVDIPEAKLFGYIEDAVSDYNLEKGNLIKDAFPLKVSTDVFKRLIKDVSWLKKVRYDPGMQDKTREERAELAAIALPKSSYSAQGLRETFENLKAAHYLRTPELVERYARMVADMLVAPQSLELLYRNDQEYIAFIQSIEPLEQSPMSQCTKEAYGENRRLGALHTFAKLIYKYIPHERWILQSQFSHDDFGIVSDDLVGEFAPNSQMFITKTKEGLALICDIYAKEPYGQCEHQGLVRRSMFSPDNTKLLAVKGGTVNIFTLSDRPRLLKALQLQHPVRSALWSPTGETLVTAAGNSGQIWDAQNWQPVGNPLQHRGPLYIASFSPNGHVMTASQDGVIQIWDAKGEPILYINPQRSDNQQLLEIRAAVLSPDGSKIGVACADNMIRLLDASNGNRLFDPLPHTRLNTNMFSWDGETFVTFADSEAYVRNANNGKILQTFKHEASVDLAIISPDGSKVLTISASVGRIWDVQNGALLSDVLKLGDVACTASFSPDCSKILITDKGGVAWVWTSLPASSFDQALLLEMIDWAKKHRRRLLPSSAQWAAQVLRTFGPAEERSIKKMYSIKDGKACVIQ